MKIDLDEQAAALIVLAEANIPPDIQELLVYGDPSRDIAPNVLGRILSTLSPSKKETVAVNPVRGKRDKEENERVYGKDTHDWLRRWDNDWPVWSIEMSGIGPGHEQCIQITMAEIVRYILDHDIDVAEWETDTEKRSKDHARIEADCLQNQRIKALQITMAQWGAALNLAIKFCRFGPVGVMTDERVRDRQIYLTKNFPSVPD